MPEFTLSKPNISDTKILTKSEQRQVEIALKESGCRLIHIELKPAKNDYFDDHFRGTVEYTPKCRNYSFHKVIIPDGTTIKEANFTQREIDTLAIEGKDLVFKECNLVNNIIDPSWKLESCNTCQVDFAKREVEELAKIEAEKLAEKVVA
jgi:hypothetical protein